MRDSTLLSVVTPAWNEAASLPLFHRTLADSLDGESLPWGCVIVDGGSIDATAATVQLLV